MKKAEIIEALKNELKTEAGLVNEAHETGTAIENNYHYGRLTGLCFALEKYGIEIERTEWQIKEAKLYKIIDIEINGEILFSYR